MEQEQRRTNMVQNIIMENREKIEISGVEDVDSFGDSKIELLTTLGNLTVTGSELHISKLNIEIGEVSVTGQIDSLIYTDHKEATKGGFFGSIFR